MLKKLNISNDDLKAVREAVGEAEKNNSGEIALAVTGESHDYAFYELFLSMIAGVVAFFILLFFHTPITNLVDRMSWHAEPWHITGIYGLLVFLVIVAVYTLTNIPAIDRLIIPKKTRRTAVYQRAVRYFVESGVYATNDHNGILLFISLMEHEVCIIADDGILRKIAQNDLNRLAENLAAGMHDKKLVPALLACIASCGTMLDTHFPLTGKEPSDELPNGLVILE